MGGRRAKRPGNLRRREVRRNLRILVSLTSIGRANLGQAELREMAPEGNN